MKALVFAAGLGTRLKPLTDNIPKALIPVGGKPMLEHVILKLKASGFNEITVNIHHKGQQIVEFLESKNNFGIHMHISDERNRLLDTGGGIKHARKYLDGDEPFLVHNADILTNVDLGQLYRHHAGNPCPPLATLAVGRRESARSLLFDKENRLCGWQNRQTGEVESPHAGFNASLYAGYAFSGIHIISPQVFEWMDGWDGAFPIISFYLAVCAKTTVRAYLPHNLQLLDIGKPETLEKAEQWLANEAQSKKNN